MSWSRYFLLVALAYASFQKVEMEETLDWWQTGVIYQIYPLSFKDSNGDGVGDLNGITQQVDYLADLGVGAVWISPIFESPMADFGYDISDYRAIDPLFGTMDDFIRLRDALHARGIKIILDLVPNHTSDEHEWFEKSVQNIAPYSDYYVWVKPKEGHNGTQVPPSNWLSFFGGSAWTWNEERQAYYLHQFHEKQPDLNYRNPAVLEEMKDVIRFWLDQGVDGFRVDMVIVLLEDDRFLDEPLSSTEGVQSDEIAYLNHIYTQNQPGSYDVVYEFRALLDSYKNDKSGSNATASTRFLAVEADIEMDALMRWYGNGTVPGAHFPFNFLILKDIDRSSTASDYHNIISEWFEARPPKSWSNWVIGNHDHNRAASRLGREFMDSLHIIQFMLPGTVVTYMGDEIAMEDTFITWDETQDPQGINYGESRYKEMSRDPERAPFQWNSNASSGFSTNQTTWLPVNPEYWNYNQLAQAKSNKSHLSIYKALLKLKSLPIIQHEESLDNVSTYHDDILVIQRFNNDTKIFYIAVINVGNFYETANLMESLSVPLEADWWVLVSSMNCELLEGETVNITSINLRPKAGLVLTNDVETSGDPTSSGAASILLQSVRVFAFALLLSRFSV